jgi:hypothetical protein
MEKEGVEDAHLAEVLLGSKNGIHNNYQNFQAFLDHGGRIGLQHDPLLYGAYAINPFLVRVERVPMIVVKQGQVAVVKAYVGLVSQDTSGAEFKFGTLVRPGHRGIWQEPLRTEARSTPLLRGGDRPNGNPHAQLGRCDSAARDRRGSGE